MALTPDDVVTKQFQHVRFKEGFDPDEVDDFLDEIVVEWRKTIAENEELKAKLAAFESGEAAPAAPVAEAPQAEEPVVSEVPAPAAAPATESDVAPASQHHEIEVLLGHRRERTSRSRALTHGSNVRPGVPSRAVARPRCAARTMSA